MPQEVLTVTATSIPNSWVLGAGASKQVAVQSNDGNTSYIRSTATINTAQQFDITTPSAVTGIDLINFVRIEASCIRGASGSGYTYKVSVVRNGTTDGANQTATGSYVTTGDNFTTRPAGGAWTLTDLQNLEIKITNTAAKEVRCSYLRVVIDYTEPPPPATPDTLVATAVSQTQIDLTWNDNATDETSQEIERSPDGSSNWANINNPGVNVESYSDTGLTAGTPYFYRVRAVNVTGPGEYSNVASATTQSSGFGKGIVFNGTTQYAYVTLPNSSPFTSMGQFQVLMRMRASNGSGGWLFRIVGFLELVDLGAGFFNLKDVRDNVNKTHITGLASNEDYIWRIQYRPNDSQWSIETWKSDGTNYVANTLGITTTSNMNLGNVVLSMGGNQFGGALAGVKYDWARWVNRIEDVTDRCPSASAPAASYFAQYEFEDNGNDTSAVAGNLTLGGTPTYESSPQQTGGVGDGSLPAPSYLSAIADNVGGTINLTWNDNSSDEDGFELWRKTHTGSWELIGTPSADSIAYNDAAVTRANLYSYKLRAKQDEGPVYSDYSPITTVLLGHVPVTHDANNKITIADSSVDFIIGPQLYNAAPNNPFQWFDYNELTHGLALGADFPAIQPRVLTGTLAATNGSTAVVGTNTKFLTEVYPQGSSPNYNGRLRITQGGTPRDVQVTSVTDDTHLTLTANWSFTTVSGAVADTYYFEPVNQVWNYDWYSRSIYYDLALCMYIAYYRTGNTTFRTYARKIADAYWTGPNIEYGTLFSGPNFLSAPRLMAFAGLMLRALDGKPEYWDYLQRFTRYQLDNWVMTHINDSTLYYDIREDGYAQLYGVLMAKVLPNSYTLYGNGTNAASTGTETGGVALRAQYLTDVENSAINFFGRLMVNDGEGVYWKWTTPADGPGGDDVINSENTFMVGLYLESVTRLHSLTSNEGLKSHLRSQITRWLKHVWDHGYDRSTVTDLTAYKWRGLHYYIHGGWTSNPTGYDPPRTQGAAGVGGTDAISSVRQRNSEMLHAFGYAYSITGDETFKTWGDDVAGSMIGDSQDTLRAYLGNVAGKEYCQGYRAGGQYLYWRTLPVREQRGRPTEKLYAVAM